MNIILLLSVFLCTSCKPQEDTTQSQRQGVKASDTLTTKALERWHTDSLGCLNLRTWKDGNILIEKFGLQHSSKDSVVTVLGKPSHVHEGTYVSNASEEIQVVEYSYFFHTQCDGDSLLPESWTTLVLSLETNKVIDISGGIH